MKCRTKNIEPIPVKINIKMAISYKITEIGYTLTQEVPKQPPTVSVPHALGVRSALNPLSENEISGE